MKFRTDKVEAKNLYTYNNVVIPMLESIKERIISRKLEKGIPNRKIAEEAVISEFVITELLSGRKGADNFKLCTFAALVKYIRELNDTNDDLCYGLLPTEDTLRGRLSQIPVPERLDWLEGIGFIRVYLNKFLKGEHGLSLYGACVLQDALKERTRLIKEKDKSWRFNNETK